MNCTQLRALIGADPAASDVAVEAHLASCPACRDYAQRVRASERLIFEALRFDVQAFKEQLASGAPVSHG